MPSEPDLSHIAFYEKERKGIYIHARLLKGSPFALGDRFSVRTGKTQLFAVTIKKDDTGDIFYDRLGIFIQRTRLVDMLMGGIFDKYVVTIAPDPPGTITLRPLDIVMDKSQKWF
jgi:hypothetical protein